MRQKELSEIKIIHLLLQYGRLKLSGSEDSILKRLHATGEGDAAASERTIRRYMDHLEKDGLIKNEDGFYSINSDYFITGKTLQKDEWKKILNDLLENRELTAYRHIRNALKDGSEYMLFDNVELEKYTEAVKESLHALSNDREIIQKVNHALAENRQIRVKYKGEEKTVYPVCYAVSRDNTRKYLYGTRRHKLLPPMELGNLEFLEELQIVNEYRESYVNQIKNAWDIDLSPQKIQILVRKNKTDSNEVIKKIRNYLGTPIENREDYNIYEGEITGINDFKTWLRSYIEICIVLQPEELKKEFMEALFVKATRYGGIQ